VPVAPISAATAARPSVAIEGASSRSFGAALEARAARPSPLPATGSPPPAVALDALKAIERAQQRLDFVLDAARRGRTFTAQELLSLQAEAYRCAQTLDIVARAVEHGAQGVKQAVNAQV
jgi:hypothetical protein